MVLSMFEQEIFPSGSTGGSVCLTIQNLMDTRIEDSELYTVTFNSIDEAVLVDENTVTITILDMSPGELY